MKIQLNDDILWDYADGLLPDKVAVAVEIALTNAPEWQAVLEKIKVEKAFLAATDAQKPPLDFSKNLMSAWTAEQAAIAKNKAKKDYSILIIFSAMAALLGVSLLIFLYALIKQAGSAMISVNTDWATDPNYWYSMLGVSILLAVGAMDRYASVGLAMAKKV